MTTPITRQTIESSAYKNVNEILNNRSYISDPREKNNTGTTGRRWILADDDEPKDINVSQYPFIVHKFPIVTYTRTSADGHKKQIHWEESIIVKVLKDGSGNQGYDIGLNDYLNICDDLHETFNKDAVKQIFRSMEMGDIKIEKISHNEEVSTNNVIYVAEFKLTYDIRLVVSP